MRKQSKKKESLSKFFRWILDNFRARKTELEEEVADYEATETFLDETLATIKELNKEKDVHSQLIQQINQVFFF